jgi:hypothetical protein
MPRPLSPTGVVPEYLRECLDVLSADPPVLRWRTRPLAHFADVENPEAALQQWRKTYTGQTIRPAADGRLRVPLRTDRGRRTLDARSIVAEIGVTPIGDMEGTPTITPNDRLAATREVAGSGPLAAVLQAARIETRRSMDALTVMSGDTDPYRLDTPAKHRDAQWFAEQVARFIAPDKRIHPRGVFYACVAAGDHENTTGCSSESRNFNRCGRARGA